MKMLLEDMESFLELQEKHFQEPTHWRMRYSGKGYWNRNERLPLGSQCLISIHLTLKEVQCSLHQAQREGQG